MQVLRPHLPSTDSETLGMGPGVFVLTGLTAIPMHAKVCESLGYILVEKGHVQAHMHAHTHTYTRAPSLFREEHRVQAEESSSSAEQGDYTSRGVTSQALESPTVIMMSYKSYPKS